MYVKKIMSINLNNNNDSLWVISNSEIRIKY